MGEFKILRAERREKIKLKTWALQESRLWPLKSCLEESHEIRHWREERPKKAG